MWAPVHPPPSHSGGQSQTNTGKDVANNHESCPLGLSWRPQLRVGSWSQGGGLGVSLTKNVGVPVLTLLPSQRGCQDTLTRSPKRSYSLSKARPIFLRT